MMFRMALVSMLAHAQVDQLYCVAVLLGLPSEVEAPSEVWSLMRSHLTTRPGRAPLRTCRGTKGSRALLTVGSCLRLDDRLCCVPHCSLSPLPPPTP